MNTGGNTAAKGASFIVIEAEFLFGDKKKPWHLYPHCWPVTSWFVNYDQKHDHIINFMLPTLHLFTTK